MPDSRLDVALTERGLCRSRTHAARLIAEGLVTVDGAPAVKPSLRVGPEQSISLAATDAYVSRAAHKLIAALDAFEIPVEDRLALDIGASTGGFTQVLLERKARHVVALDVGHDQFAVQLRQDARITVVEGVNARYLNRAILAQHVEQEHDADLVVADLSFISLRQVLPALVETVSAASDFVLLIKPQFEVGRTGIKEGLVRDPGLRADAIKGVLWAAWDLGLGTAGLIESPIAGGAGNREYLAWLNAEAGRNPTEWNQTIQDISRAGP